jgi:Fe(3+) dicitrate transport protein
MSLFDTLAPLTRPSTAKKQPISPRVTFACQGWRRGVELAVPLALSLNPTQAIARDDEARAIQTTPNVTNECAAPSNGGADCVADDTLSRLVSGWQPDWVAAISQIFAAAKAGNLTEALDSASPAQSPSRNASLNRPENRAETLDGSDPLDDDAATDSTEIIEIEFSDSEPQANPQESVASGTDDPSQESSRALAVDTVWVLGPPEALPRVAGSAHHVTKSQLERDESDDIERVLTHVPGVYVRGEDGFGLRPNIGLRGASSDRSAKVTLMEDGILLAPAPYSAPAAYYFPLTTRIVGVEVFKGPATVRHGPQTIGGAINLQSRPIPQKSAAEIDVAQGRFDYSKIHSFWGHSGAHWGILLEGVHLDSSGFKRIDGAHDADTGFRKNEGIFKLRFNGDPAAAHYHQIEFKGGFSNEVSNETYLGLSDLDFENTPYRRYAASARDRMQWWRSQAQVQYTYAYKESLDLQVSVYRNDLDRAWRKLNRFRGGPELDQILKHAQTGAFAVYHAILAGHEDSTTPEQTLMIGVNDRRYVSQGIATLGHLRLKWGQLSQDIEAGARLHYDSIRRDHNESGFLMNSGSLVVDGSDETTTTRNKGEALAGAVHLHDLMVWRRLSLTPGIRLEIVRTAFHDRLANSRAKSHQVSAIPGGGLHVAANDWLGLYSGVYYGYSPVSPGQDKNISPERSLNYEGGARVRWGATLAEASAFFNDYRNLTGECTLSSGCDDNLLNRQFNAGRVHIYGIEALASHRFEFSRFFFGLDGNYTFTGSRFRSNFSATFPLWGEVQKNDEVPYVPRHRASATMSGGNKRFESSMTMSAVGEMRDVAGQGSIPDDERIAPYVVFDLNAHLSFYGGRLRAYTTFQNLFNAQYMVSRRPFGARPGLPFSWVLGIKARVF